LLNDGGFLIARLALLEAGITFESRLIDVHFAKEQITPWCMALNPHISFLEDAS
jgi:glutathione S-transferase